MYPRNRIPRYPKETVLLGQKVAHLGEVGSAIIRGPFYYQLCFPGGEVSLIQRYQGEQDAERFENELELAIFIGAGMVIRPQAADA